MAILFLSLLKLELAEFDMNQICQELKTDTWALMSNWDGGSGLGREPCCTIQLQTMINNSGPEMLQYRAHSRFKNRTHTEVKGGDTESA